MSAVEAKLRKMGYTLPPTFKFPNPNRTGCVVVGSIVFVSGHGRDLPSLPNVKSAGKVGRDLTVEEGYATARAVGLSILASLKQQLGEFNQIKRVVRLFGMVNAAPGFDRMPQVIDGASCPDFFYELFGPENGQHARSAVGLAELPHGIPVEINGEFEFAQNEMSRETKIAAGHPGCVRRSAVTTVRPGERSGTLTTGGFHGCSVASHCDFGSGS